VGWTKLWAAALPIRAARAVRAIGRRLRGRFGRRSCLAKLAGWIRPDAGSGSEAGKFDTAAAPAADIRSDERHPPVRQSALKLHQHRRVAAREAWHGSSGSSCRHLMRMCGRDRACWPALHSISTESGGA
jgi:hypothetical protein